MNKAPDEPRLRLADCSTAHSQGAMAIPAGGRSLAAILACHALRDGELIILALKPSLWFILLTSLRFIGCVLFLALAAALVQAPTLERGWSIVPASMFLIFGRLTWATLQWMGRIYVLTDQRILRVQGVLRMDVFDCPLRKIARADLMAGNRERLFRLGSIFITPIDTALPLAQWQMVARPAEVYARVVDEIERSRQAGNMFAAA